METMKELYNSHLVIVKYGENIANSLYVWIIRNISCWGKCLPLILIFKIRVYAIEEMLCTVLGKIFNISLFSYNLNNKLICSNKKTI